MPGHFVWLFHPHQQVLGIDLVAWPDHGRARSLQAKLPVLIRF